MTTITAQATFGTDVMAYIRNVMDNFTLTGGNENRATFAIQDINQVVNFRGTAGEQPVNEDGIPIGPRPFQTVTSLDLTAGARDAFTDEVYIVSYARFTGLSVDVDTMLAAVKASNDAFLKLLGNITFVGSAGVDVATLGAGKDTLNMGAGNDAVHAGSGDDTVSGDAGNDTLYGDSGDDTITGGAGRDRLYGGSGDDHLNSAGGGDRLEGGSGDDLYDVNGDDKIIEKAGGGTDRAVIYNGAFTLGAGVSVEKLELWSQAAARDITGNEISQTIKGNFGANTLAGLGGNDTIYGYVGKDDLRGGDGDDKLFGDTDDDRIDGGYGSDALSGGDGRDSFVFRNSLNKAGNVDTIADFSHADDTMELSHAEFAGLGKGTLSKYGFKEISGATSTKGVDGTDRILYDKKHGDLYFDRDGSGADYNRVLFAHVKDNTGLDHTDFKVVLDVL